MLFKFYLVIFLTLNPGLLIKTHKTFFTQPQNPKSKQIIKQNNQNVNHGVDISELKKIYYMANSTYLDGNHELAKNLYSVFIEYSSSLNKVKELWHEIRNSYTYLGTISSNNSEFEKAIEFKKCALQLTIDNNDNDITTKIIYLFDIAKNYYNLSDYSSALNFYNEAEYLANKNQADKNIYVSQIYNNIGLCYFKMGAIKSAEKYSNMALKIKNINRNHIELIHSYNNLGILYMKAKNKEKALQHFSSGLKIIDSINAPLEKAFILNNIGNLYLKENSFDSCAYYYIKSYHLRKANHADTIELIQSMNNLSLTYLRLGNTILAQKMADSALILNQNNQLYDATPISLSDYLISISNLIEINTSNYNKSGGANYLLESHNLFTNSLESIIEAIPLSHNSARSFFLTQNKRIFDSAIESERLLDSRFPTNYPRTLAISETFKTLIYLNAKFDIDNFNSLNNLDIHKNFNCYLEAINGISQINEDNSKKEYLPLDSIVNIYLKNGKNSTNFDRSIKKHLLKHVYNIGNYLIQSNSSDTSKAMIDYYVSGNRLYINLFAQGKYYSYRRDFTNDLSQEISDLNNNIKSLNHEKVNSLSSDLYNLLFKEISKWISNSKTLTIVPDCTLSELPFEILKPYSATLNSALFLINSYDISYRFTNTRNNINQALDTNSYRYEYVGIAPFDSSSHTSQSLHNSVFEINYAKQIFSNTNRESITLVGKDASLDKITNLENLNSRIFQLSTHSKIENPIFQFSSLGLSPNSEHDLMYISSFSTLPFHNELFILSGCNTAVNLINGDNGQYSFISAISKPTIKNILGTLWNIYDAPTYNFLKIFYDKIIEGNTYSKSLSIAKRIFIQSENYFDPIFWAAFVLYEED